MLFVFLLPKPFQAVALCLVGLGALAMGIFMGVSGFLGSGILIGALSLGIFAYGVYVGWEAANDYRARKESLKLRQESPLSDFIV